MRDTVPLVMKADGVDPADATEDDWLAAIDKLKEAVDSGQILGFTGNNYINDLATRRRRGGDRLVRRRDSAPGRQPGHPVRDAGPRAASSGRTTW